MRLSLNVRIGVTVLVLALPGQSGFASSETVAQVDGSIERGVEFLQAAQQPNGEFAVSLCYDQALTHCLPDSATSATGQVLYGLSFVVPPKPSSLVAKATDFLLAQMTEGGVYYYHTNTNPSYPAEVASLEDTVFNRMALEAVGVSLAPMTPPLLTYHTAEGLFLFLAIPPEQVKALRVDASARERFLETHRPQILELANVVDLVANARILSYLAAHKMAHAKLCGALVRKALEDVPSGYSVFHESPYAFIYAISHAYAQGARCLQPAKPILQARLLKRQRADGSWGSVIETAWALSALINLGYHGEALDQAVSFLLAQQRPNGSWDRAVWWIFRSPPHWFGSEEVSTGIVLEALGRYGRVRKTMKP